MLARKSVVEQIEFPSGGGVAVRIALLIIDGDKVLSSAWHRTMIAHGGNAVTQMSYVQAHLAEMGEELLSQDDINRVVGAHQYSVANPSPHFAPAVEIQPVQNVSAGPLQPKQ